MREMKVMNLTKTRKIISLPELAKESDFGKFLLGSFDGFLLDLFLSGLFFVQSQGFELSG